MTERHCRRFGEKLTSENSQGTGENERELWKPLEREKIEKKKKLV